jgi:hypothetical protein
LDFNVAKWIMSAAHDTYLVTRPSGTVYFAQMDAPPRDQLQIVDGGASQFINANRHEFHDYEVLPIDSRYKLRGVPATVYGIGTTNKVHTTTTGERISTTLSNVLHAPDFVQFPPHGISRLFSQGRAQDAGASFNYAQQCTMTLPSGACILIRRLPEWRRKGVLPFLNYVQIMAFVCVFQHPTIPIRTLLQGVHGVL